MTGYDRELEEEGEEERNSGGWEARWEGRVCVCVCGND